MNTLNLVVPGQHTAEDLEFLLDADNSQPLIDRIPLLQIDHKLRTGEMMLFRLNPGPGTCICTVVQEHGVRRLEVTRGAGHYAPSLRNVLKELWTLAVELGCECVTTVVYSERFQKALVLSGAQVEGWMLTYSEASHGHQEENQDEFQRDTDAEAA
jgi:hypothetical protein